jgi:serine protease inhibitor
VVDKELNSQVITLPYQGDDLQMVIILPTTKPKVGTPPAIVEVVKKLTFAKFEQLMADLEKTDTSITNLLIPKFVSEGDYRLKEVYNSISIFSIYT